MKVVELLRNDGIPNVSYEIVPPKRGGSVSEILEIIDQLMEFDPPFVDVTSHSAQIYYEEQQDGSWRRHIKRKRPGTLGLCAAIKGRFGIETVPHLLCKGFTREESEDALIELNYLGIQNVMALRGDDSGFQKPIHGDRTKNEYAIDLVRQIHAMNSGHFLEELIDAAPTDFCVGVAGYPEKHFEAPNIKWDVKNLKNKIDAGAEYITTQMFFNNDSFFEFEKACRSAGITAPIIPGLKVLTSKSQLQTLPSRFYLQIPEELASEIAAAKDHEVPEIGIRWATKQCDELLSRGFSNLHFYIIQTPNHVSKVVKSLRKKA